jgi:hypothetical protein
MSEELSGVKVRPVRKADKLTAINESIMETMCDPPHLKNYRASRPVNGIAFSFFRSFFFIIDLSLYSFIPTIYLSFLSTSH